MDDLAAIQQTFFQECEEQLVELERGLLSIQEGDADPETVNAVFRAVHSIKGGAGAFDLNDLVRYAHVFENTLDLVRTGRLTAEPALIETMLRATDVLADLVKAARDGHVIDPVRVAEASAELSSHAETVAGAAPAASETLVFEPIAVSFDAFDDLSFEEKTSHVFEIRFAPRPALYANGNDTGIIFRELEKLGRLSITCDDSLVPLLSDLDPLGAYLSWTLSLETEKDRAAVAELFEFVEWDSDILIEERCDDEPVLEVEDSEPVIAAPTAQAPVEQPIPATKEAVETGDRHAPKAVPPAATIRVDIPRVDRLIDLVGELVINQAMLNERIADLQLPRMSPVSIALNELGQLTRDMQESVMAIRAQPVRSVFQRLPRLVRELAAQTGKTVRLETEGEDTEVDKTVIERLIDPLTHMIRNAVDHGLEGPEDRISAGKAEEGCLRITTSHRSGRIIIEIADDGAGINRERVRDIAISKNLISPEAKLTDEEIDELIFLPGFSTAKTVSDISGRGVGMDVVRRSIQALGGRISIASVPGKGSTFTMSLPLTLAVLDGMVVSVADETLVIPLNTIVEILMPQTMVVHSLGEESRVVGLRGQFVPLVDVGRRLAYRTDAADPKKGVVLLVEADGGGRNALVVDAIQGQCQVVIKSLEANYGSVSGIAAATILGNGRVALILDVDTLVADTPAEGAPTIKTAA